MNISTPDEYFLTTDHLGFRCWTEADKAFALGLWGDPQVTRMLVGRSPMSRFASGSPGRSQWCAISVFSIGRFSSLPQVSTSVAAASPYKPRIPELGFHLRQAFWGQGIAKEAATAMIDYAFARLDVNAIFAGHYPENTNSRKVLLSLGFQYIGEERYPPTGTMHPSYILRRPFPHDGPA